MIDKGTSQMIVGSTGDFVLIDDCSTACRQNIEGYVMWKNGQQGDLPVGHPSKDAPPTV